MEQILLSAISAMASAIGGTGCCYSHG